MLHRPYRSISFRDLKIPYAEKLVGTAKNDSKHRSQISLHRIPRCTIGVFLMHPGPIVSNSFEAYSRASLVRLVAQPDLTPAVNGLDAKLTPRP